MRSLCRGWPWAGWWRRRAKRPGCWTRIWRRLDGVVPPPQRTLVTGYDFLVDAAQAVQTEFEAGTGFPANTLITPRDVSPLDPASWTAQDLSAALLNQRNDLVFLAGHFSASSALAADYSTRLRTSDLLASPVDLSNTLIFSAGCHSGYNIVNAHGVSGVTQEPDWAQAFARKGRDSDRRYGLSIWRHGLPEIQRSVVRSVQPRTAHRRRPRRGGQGADGGEAELSRKRCRSCAALTRRRCWKRPCSVCRCSASTCPVSVCRRTAKRRSSAASTLRGESRCNAGAGLQ